MAKSSGHRLEEVLLTPEMAAKMLELNGLNRPLSEAHVSRIANQIKSGLWRFNGDTIKIAVTNDVLDGQHRLWAVVEAQKAILTVVIYGIEREAFSTIDTIRRPRSGGDVLALAGAQRYRTIMSSALQWLARYQKGTITAWRDPRNRIENSEIEKLFEKHGGIAIAAERAVRVRRVVNPALMTFLYYIMTNRNADIAERMMRTLEYPSSVAVDDPFFNLRAYFLSDRERMKLPLTSIALTFKAANLAFENKTTARLKWNNQGEKPEAFPVLKIDPK